MILPSLKDAGYVTGAAVLAFGMLAVMFSDPLTGFGLWPEFLKWAVWSLFCIWLGVAAGYAFGWKRRPA